MIFNNDIIFIHIGKTGGMSCARYLLENLHAPVFNCHEFAEQEMLNNPIDGVVPLADTHRHWSLQESLDYLKKSHNKNLSDFKKVLAVVRNPFSLEYSFYNHMKKPHVQKQRGPASQPIFNLADGDFTNFVRHAGYHAPGKTQDDFVRIDGEIPDLVELVRFESIDPDFINATRQYTKPASTGEFSKRNKTNYKQELAEYMSDELKDIVYKKHKYMFDSGMYSIDEASAPLDK